jgi:hypothetical protein
MLFRRRGSREEGYRVDGMRRTVTFQRRSVAIGSALLAPEMDPRLVAMDTSEFKTWTRMEWERGGRGERGQ